MPARGKLTLKKWARIRSIWESGNGTFALFAKEYKISEQTIRNKSHKEGWILNGQKAAIEAKVAEKNSEIFARLKMPKEERIKKLIDGINGKVMDTKKITEIAKDKNDKIIFLPNGRPMTIDRSVSVIDNSYMLECLKESFRLCNDFPAPMQAVQENPENEDVPIPHVSDMPEADPQVGLTQIEKPLECPKQ